MFDFSTFPILETDNLILRRMNDNDVCDLFEMRHDQILHEYTDTIPDKTVIDTKKYLSKMNKGVDDNKWIIWAIMHKQLNKVIGTISIWNFNKKQMSGELSYGMARNYQGQGFMKEALLCVTYYGFNHLNLKEIDAYTEESNLKSRKLLERCDFVDMNIVVDEGNANNRVYHMIVYRLVNKYIKR